MQQKGLSGKVLVPVTLLSFLIPCAALTAIFYFSGIYPFGENSIFLESNSQWFSGVAAVHKAMLGQGSLFYSFSDSLGGDFYTRFASGLCSPFLFITFFFKEAAIHDALTLVMCVKAGFAGLFSFLMFSRIAKDQPLIALPFSVAYGAGSLLSLGFLAPELTDCAVFLPLVGAGIAMLVDKGSILVLYVALVMFFMSSSTLWPCCLIFCLIVLIWLRQVRSNQSASLMNHLSLLLLCVALSVGATMIMSIPAFSANVHAATAVHSLSEIDTVPVFDLLSALFPGAAAPGTVTALIFTSALTLIMLPVYFLNKAFSQKERLIGFITVAVILLSLMLAPVGWVLLTFSQPTGTVVASSFIFALLACMAAARAFVKPIGLKVGTVIIAWISTLCLYLAAVFFGNIDFSTEGIIFTIAFMTLYATVTLVTVSKNTVNIGFCAMLTMCILCETVFGGTLAVMTYSRSEGSMSYSQYADSLSLKDSMRSMITANEPSNSEFFRIRGTDISELNSISAPCPSQTEQSSLLMDVLGVSDGRGYTRFTDALFSVRYTVGKSEQVGSYQTIGNTVSGDVIAYNQNTLPLCFAASKNVLSLTEYSSNPFDAQNQLASAICGADRALFYSTEYQSSGNGVSFVDTLNGIELTRGAETGYVSFAVTAPCDGTLYLYMDCDTGYSETITVNGAKICTQPLDSIIPLGFFYRGDTAYIDVSIHSERAILNSLSFASLDESLLAATITELSQGAAQYITVENNVVTGTASIGEDQVLLTTIPWQDGWTCELDRDTDSEISCAAGSLIALELTPDTHSFILTYSPPDFSAASIISVILGLLGLVLVAAVELRRRKHSTPLDPDAPDFTPSDSFAPAGTTYPAHEVDVSEAYTDSFVQRQQEIPQYYYQNPMYPTVMPYMGVMPDGSDFAPEPVYEDFSSMAASRGYDPNDTGHYQLPAELTPIDSVPQETTSSPDSYIPTIPEPPVYPSAPAESKANKKRAAKKQTPSIYPEYTSYE